MELWLAVVPIHRVQVWGRGREAGEIEKERDTTFTTQTETYKRDKRETERGRREIRNREEDKRVYLNRC